MSVSLSDLTQINQSKKGVKVIASVKMANLRMLLVFELLMLVSSKVWCYQYKVGDLDAWGIPSSANSEVYAKWSKYHSIKIGDSLLFLYPPSQDSVIQVTEESYKSCNLKDPILYMNNGNSLFNITSYGEFYFTSDVAGHCEKKQKLHISVLGVGGNGTAAAPSYSPTALPEFAPSYPTVFGTIPVSPSSSSLPTLPFPTLLLGFSIVSALQL